MHKDRKTFKPFTTRKNLILTGIVSVLIFLLCMSFVIFAETQVTVIDGENVSYFKTKNISVSKMLEENKIFIGEFDELSCDKEAKVKDVGVVEIFRAKTIFINADGQKNEVNLVANTVNDVLAKAGHSLGELDEVNPPIEELVISGMEITVLRGRFEEKTVIEDIPFEIENINNSDLIKGQTRVKTKGAKGSKKIVYNVLMVGDEERSAEIISETIEKEPVTQVVENGTKAIPMSSRGAELRAKSVITVSASAYDGESLRAGARTAAGLKPAVGIVAVDPKVIPLGSRLYIESADGGKSWVYGYAIAGDTGGSIKGNKIDLFYEKRSEAINFGRRQATVYILEN